MILASEMEPTRALGGLVERVLEPGMTRYQFLDAVVRASEKGPSSYTAQLPTPTGRSMQQGGTPAESSFEKSIILTRIMEFGSEDPAGPTKTTCVLTIIHTEGY